MTSRTVGANETTYVYTDMAHVHAVTSLSDGSSFTYDANGNMTYRDYDGATYLQKFDVENPAIAALAGTFRRPVAITDTQTLSVPQFIYNGDGNRVKTIYPDGSWTAFPKKALGLRIGDHYEVDSDGKTRSYYFLGAQRIAMRIQQGQNDNLYFFHTDHLGSTSLLSDENGEYVAGTEARYLPYGGYRVEPTADLTDHGFTGHKQQDEVGLIYMRARFYVPGLGRFLSADTIVPDPGNPQNLNRYSYVSNNPLKYLDPSGHVMMGEQDDDRDYWETWAAVSGENERINEIQNSYDSTKAALESGVMFVVVVAAPIVLPSAIEYGTQQLLEWIITHPVETVVLKAIVEEVIEAEVTDTPIDPFMIGLDICTQVGDDYIPRRDRRFNPTWPNTPEEMDEMLGIPGVRIPDGPTTPGRNKVKWNVSDSLTITYEEHPYDTNAPDFHRLPHWHLSYPDTPHSAGIRPGTPIYDSD